MLADLPARWRREADECWQLAEQRRAEGRRDATGRLVARASTWQRAAEELEAELVDPSAPPTVHTAPD